METNRIRKTIAILLVVMFVLTVTVAEVSAKVDKSTGSPTSYKNNDKVDKISINKNKKEQGLDGTSQGTNMATNAISKLPNGEIAVTTLAAGNVLKND
jgi:hypothetical protein